MKKELFKTDLIFDRFNGCHSVLKKIAYDMYEWCVICDAPFMITAALSTEEEDKKLNRVSSTHREGRAFDLSCFGWDKDRILVFKTMFSEKYKDVAAISPSTNKPTLIIHHDNGNGMHFHVQIRSGLSDLNIS